MTEVADTSIDDKTEQWMEFVDRLYVLTLVPIEEQALRDQFVLYGEDLQSSLHHFEYYNLTELLMENEEVSSFLKVYVKKVRNVYVKYYFNEKGYEKMKREKKVKDIPFDLPRPEKAVIFPNRFLFLLEDRFKEEYAKGRKAFVDLLGSVYDPQRPKLMISLPDMDELVRNNLARSENLHSLNQFRRKYFPNMKSLSKMISKLCWEEIEFDVEQNALRLVTDPIEFKKNLEVQLAYRRQLLDSIDRQLLSFKDKYPEEPMKYKPVTNQKQRSPLRRTYRGCDTSSEDDMTRRYRPFTKSELGTDNEHEIGENLVTKSEKTDSNALASTTESHPQHPSYKTKGLNKRDDLSSSNEDLRARYQPLPVLKKCDGDLKAMEEEKPPETPKKALQEPETPDSPDLVPVPVAFKCVRPFYTGPPSEDEEYERQQREKKKRFGDDAPRPKYNLVPEN